MTAARMLTFVFSNFLLNGRLETTGNALNALLIRSVSSARAGTRLLIRVPISSTRDLPIAVRMRYLLGINVNLTRMARTRPNVRVLNSVVSEIRLSGGLEGLLSCRVINVRARELAIARHCAHVVILVRQLLVNRRYIRIRILRQVSFYQNYPARDLSVVSRRRNLTLYDTELNGVLLISVIQL